MQSLRSVRVLWASLPQVQALHTSAGQFSSNLERFISGNYDPVAENKKREEKRGTGDGGDRRQSGRQHDRSQARPGGEARRQALGFARDRGGQSRYGDERQFGEQRMQSQGRGQGRGRGRGRGRGSQQRSDAPGGDARAASSPFLSGPGGADMDADIADPELEESVHFTQGRGRRGRQGRQSPQMSMMGMINDRSGVTPAGRGGRAGRSPGAAGRGRGRGMQGGRAPGRGRGRGMQVAEGTGQSDEAKRRAQKFLGTGEDAEEDEDADTSERHPEDYIEGIEDEEGWNLIEENKFGEVEEPVKTGQAIDSHAYTLDADGVTVEHVWENMSYEDLRNQLMMEMTYSRHDHEAWLRGPGRADLEAARMEVGQGPFTPEEFEEEVQQQMQLFNRYTWIDDLYYFAKHRQVQEKALKAALLAEQETDELMAILNGHLISPENPASENPAPENPASNEDASEAVNTATVNAEASVTATADSTADTKATESDESSKKVLEASQSAEGSSVAAETSARSENAMHASDASAATEADESAGSESKEDKLVKENLARLHKIAEEVGIKDQCVTEEQAREMGLLDSDEEMPSKEEQQAIADDVLTKWMTENSRQSLRETRMLRKFWAIRETARIGITPRRKGSEFNRQEFDALVLDKMMEMVEPTRPRNFQGNFLSERQAVDANKAMLFDSHPEMMPHFERPELFPMTTMESMSRENFDARMDSMREDIYHPLAGIHSEEDWQELKDMTYEKLPELMRKRVAMHQRVGFSGLMGGFMEDAAYLDGVWRQIMPDDHPNVGPMLVYADKICTNAQWDWPYKIRAVKMIAKYLMRADKFAEDRRREDEEMGQEGYALGRLMGAAPRSMKSPPG